MLRVLTMLALVWLLAGTGQAALTAREARDASRDAVQMLVVVNAAFADHHFHHGAWDKSVAVQERVIALRPTEVDAYANAAWLLWSTQQVERALDVYRRMVANNPANPEAYYVFGGYYFFRKQYAEALPLLAQGVRLGMPPPKSHLYGHCLEKLGRTDEALAFWRGQLAARPDDAVVQHQIQRLTAPAPTTETPAP